MDLILWRHAEAHDALVDQTDADRPLTPKGERQARRMAAWLARHLPDATRVLVSPSVRTRKTAEALDRKYRVVDELAPDRGTAELLQVTRWPDARTAVLVVGHQPTLGLTAAFLMGSSEPAWSLCKGGVIWLRHRHRDDGPEVLIHAVLGPKLL